MTLPLETKAAVAVPGSEPTRTLIDALLAEQRELTAVEEFARVHERHEITQPRYRALLPASAPQPGQQYAFEVDLDQCSGCKACVTACHSLNGLDDDETWRSVGRLTSTDWRTPLQQVVTTACHHCVDPACLNGCPVLAYDKDPVTGIVRHLDDQCIGCQYCAMKCPYDVPQYSKTRGIVRKCDMCSSRLAVGEAPACVQACPNEAIRITVVEQAKVRGRYRELPTLHGTGKGKKRRARSCDTSAQLPTDTNVGQASRLPGLAERVLNGTKAAPSGAAGQAGRLPYVPAADSAIVEPPRCARETSSAPAPPANTFLPDSPDPAITLPTTRYLSQRALPIGLKAVDADEVRRAKAHLPLTVMLVLSQFGAGLALMDALTDGGSRGMGIVALAVMVLGVLAGALHLGQPLKAWRSFLGWRKSWLSRELIAFGFFIGALGVHLLLGRSLSAILVALAGLLAVACSAMVYVDTRRPFWNAPMTFGKFFGTTLLLGGAGALMLSALGAGSVPPWNLVVSFVVLGAAFKLAVEQRIFRKLEPHDLPVWKRIGAEHGFTGSAGILSASFSTPSNANRRQDAGAPSKTALLLTGPLGPFARLRVMCAIVGGVVLPVMMLASAPNVGLTTLAFVLCLLGELMERHLFFVAEVAPKMPGDRGL